MVAPFRSGVLVIGHSNSDGIYAQQAYQNDVSQGARVLKLEEGAMRSTLKEIVGSEAKVAIGFEGMNGYLNYDNGWADAGKATAAMISTVKALGGKVIGGKTVSKLIRKDGGATAGVECVDGSSFGADLVVLATGSWTPSTFPDLALEVKCVATGQCVAMIQLTREEADAYRNIPVTLNFETGFYSFPPTTEGIVKMAFHRAGFTHTVEGISRPRTVTTHPENGLSIPREVLNEFRETFKTLYPDLGQKPFLSTRLCWYTDTPDGNWLIGKHPKDPGLVLATGGSGHAFKFLPVLGRIVVEAIEGTLDPQLTEKFSPDRPITHGDASRKEIATRELILEHLTSPEDLIA